MRPVVNTDFGSGDPNEKFRPRLERFKFLDRDNRADKVELTFENSDQLLTEYYPPGLQVSFSWGYAGRMARPRLMKIRKIKGAGERHLILEGYSKEFEMDRVMRTRAFFNVTYVEIAEQIAAEHGYPFEAINIPDPEELILPVYEVVNQSAETDAAFLRRLADDLPQFVFWMDERQFYFNEPGHDKKPRRVIEYRSGMLLGNVTGLDSDLNLISNPVRITKKSRDPKTKETKTAVAEGGISDMSAALGKYEPDLFGLGQEVGTVFDTPTGTHDLFDLEGSLVYYEGGVPIWVGVAQPAGNEEQEEEDPTSETDQKGIQQEADQKLKKKKSRRVRYSLKMDPGDPYFLAKEVIELRRASIFTGPAYVKEVSHEISAGKYAQEAKLVKGYLGRKPKKTKAAQQMERAKGEVNPGRGSTPDVDTYSKLGPEGIEHTGFVGELGVTPSGFTKHYTGV